MTPTTKLFIGHCSLTIKADDRKATKGQIIQSLMCFCPTCQTYSWITFNKSLAQERHLNQFLNLIRQVNQVEQQGLWHGSDSNIMPMPRWIWKYNYQPYQNCSQFDFSIWSETICKINNGHDWVGLYDMYVLQLIFYFS